jgi:hypothetical protein
MGGVGAQDQWTGLDGVSCAGIRTDAVNRRQNAAAARRGDLMAERVGVL